MISLRVFVELPSSDFLHFQSIHSQAAAEPTIWHGQQGDGLVSEDCPSCLNPTAEAILVEPVVKIRARQPHACAARPVAAVMRAVI